MVGSFLLFSFERVLCTCIYIYMYIYIYIYILRNPHICKRASLPPRNCSLIAEKYSFADSIFRWHKHMQRYGPQQYTSLGACDQLHWVKVYIHPVASSTAPLQKREGTNSPTLDPLYSDILRLSTPKPSAQEVCNCTEGLF